MDDEEIIRNGSIYNDVSEQYERNMVEFQPWLRQRGGLSAEQEAIQLFLKDKKIARRIGKDVFIAKNAKILCSSLEIGDKSWIADGVIVRGHVKIGSSSSINPNCYIAGKVQIGSGVRVAGHVSIYGFNHGFARTDVPIYFQPHTSEGISIGDGTWIGANVVIVDGCKIGAHCIVAGGAVVTRDVQDYQIVGGSPARLIRDRRSAPSSVIHSAS